MKDNGSNVGTRETLQPEILLDPNLDKKIWRKLDLYIMPVVTLTFFLFYLDQANIGNASIAGLHDDLGITNRQYSIVLTAGTVSFIIAELPSNLLLKRIGPNIMLPTMLTLWGLLPRCKGLFIITRFFLGLCDGGLMPGLVLYVSFFYPRQWLNWRISIFFSSISIGGAFSSLLAYAIVHMDGVGGKRGWAWIFILEGLATIVFGIVAFRLLPRSPTFARFLTEKEKDYLHERLKNDGATSKDESMDAFNWREVVKTFTLPQVWMLSVLSFFSGTIVSSMAFFTPSIVQDMGYSAVNAQLMSVPPFVLAFVLTMFFSYLSDRYQCRGLVSSFSSLLSVIGLSIFLEASNPKIRYSSLFFVIPGANIAAPVLATWNANNVTPHMRRGTAIAICFTMTTFGAMLAQWLLGSLSVGPRYLLAARILLSFSALMVVFAALNTLYLWRQNKKKAEIRQMMSPEQEKPGLGDKSSWYVYNL